jgi:hypothetical protein
MLVFPLKLKNNLRKFATIFHHFPILSLTVSLTALAANDTAETKFLLETTTAIETPEAGLHLFFQENKK